MIAAAVVGGVAIFGGTGSVYGAALGALLLGTITSSLIVLRVEAFWQQAAIGALLLIAIALRPLPRPARRGRPAQEERAPCKLRRPRPAPRARRVRRDRLRAFAGRWEALLLGLIVVTAIVGQGLSSEFLTTDSFTTGSLDFSEVALMALPLTLVIIAAEIDLSVASVLALSSAIAASLWNHGLPVELIIPLCLVAGALCGAFNGVLVTRFGLPSLAVTIGTLALFRGLAFVVIGDESVTDFPGVWTDRAFGNFAGTFIPDTIVLFAILGRRLRRAAARDAVRALDLRDRRQRGGGVLRGPARQADQADPVRALGHGRRARRHRHLAAQLDRRRQRRPGLRADRDHRGAARRRLDLRRPRHAHRRRRSRCSCSAPSRRRCCSASRSRRTGSRSSPGRSWSSRCWARMSSAASRRRGAAGHHQRPEEGQ